MTVTAWLICRSCGRHTMTLHSDNSTGLLCVCDHCHNVAVQGRELDAMLLRSRVRVAVRQLRQARREMQRSSKQTGPELADLRDVVALIHKLEFIGDEHGVGYCQMCGGRDSHHDKCEIKKVLELIGEGN